MKQREVVIGRESFDGFKGDLLKDPNLEQMAFLLAGANLTDGALRLLVHEVILVPPEGLAAQSGGYIEARKEFVRPILERCHREGLSLIEAHSHPFTAEGVSFSGVDIAGEWRRFPFVASKSPHIFHGTLVVGQTSIDGHMWLKEAQAVIPITGVRVVGVPLGVIPITSMRPLLQGLGSLVQEGLLPPDGGPVNWERFSRQVLAFGPGLQERLAKVTVAVVGVGGIGSHVVQQLAYLGVGNFILVDMDAVDESNLHRLVGARPDDLGKPKVEVGQRVISTINGNAKVKAVTARVEDPSSVMAVKAADIIISGMDTQLSRLVLNRVATQYLIPYIDCGTGFLKGDGGALEAMGGQVRTVLPDGPCLECMGGISHDRVSDEIMTPEERRIRAEAGYGLGIGVIQPAVVSLNGVVASLAVTELINLLVGFKPFQPYIFYDALTQRQTPVTVSKNPNCVCCGTGSSFALGDLQPIPSTSEAPGQVPRSDIGARQGDDSGGETWHGQSQETQSPRGLLGKVRQALRRP